MQGKRRHRKLLAFILASGMLLGTLGQADTASAAKRSIKKIQLKKPVIQTLALKKGERYKLKYTVKPKALAKKVTITSGKKSVVSVNKKGVLNAKKAGKTTITIQSRTTPKKKVKLKVTVYKKFQKVKKVKLNRKSATLAPGSSLTLKAALSPKKATVKKVIYKSSKKSVATVNQKGVVTANKTGTAKITAYAKDGRGAKAVCRITVRNDAAQSGGTAAAAATETPKATATAAPIQDQPYEDKFLLSSGERAVPIYVDAAGSDYEGLRLVAESFAGDMALVSEEGVTPQIKTKQEELNGSAIIVGSIGNNDVIDSLIEK